ncbi:permease [Dongia mobilis]|uniref:permease n=1 Tax=Dongia sp. TaxID=1977262 RepID=UPI0026F08517
MSLVLQLLNGGVGNLAAYLAAHVLLCLLPAFFIAGAMAALIPKASITRWLGRTTPRHVSYPAAAVAGSLLAVCSCTIVPLFAGIYRKGAGIGPAMTFLFFAPAGNVMALAYTGSILGVEFAVARVLLCLLFGIGIGMLMALLFRRDDASHDAQTDALFADKASINRAAIGVLLSLVALLIAGTLRLWPLTETLTIVSLKLPWVEAWQAMLFQWVPFDAAKGEEGVSVQGSLLIALLILIGATAYKGMENIVEGANRWTWVTLGLAATTLLVAALRFAALDGRLEIAVTGRVIAVGLALLAIGHYARRLDPADWQAWLWESWRFVKQIFLLLVIGVFAVGVIRQLIQPEWIEALAGRNDLLANATAVVFGVFMYFPTLVEVPVARMFLDLGMHPGPLLAYL